jgi:hypothetical protein
LAVESALPLANNHSVRPAQAFVISDVFRVAESDSPTHTDPAGELFIRPIMEAAVTSTASMGPKVISSLPTFKI